ncbi:D-2-hydroxyacid dehydrogenase [Thalassovita sp.]|uniref:D-2-hydroxyacid dehydrogenase n=1 Tax=Thalassovita sp. TaxID=1979401 RepID=UPI0029DE894E|nr:D-2-hydroxyacid dehydrogenase [Thalassovita sp.]
MTKIVFLDRATMGPSVELTRPQAPHDWDQHDRSSADDVVSRLAGAQVAITNKVPITRAALEQLPELKFVTVAATGYDVIDLAACRDHGVTVSNVRGYAINTVPEHTMALILSLKRAIPGYRQAVLDGRWQEENQFCFFDYPICDLAGANIGIIGEGVIGQAVARLAQAFGMHPLFAAHKGVEGLGPLYTPFDQMLEQSDVITCHAPLTPATRDVLAMADFRKMKRRPIIINTARGGLVNEADAVAALEEGLISGLGFDVLTTEPPSADNPIYQVAARPDVIITPHTAWASDQAMAEVWRQVVESIDAFLAGSPVRILN